MTGSDFGAILGVAAILLGIRLVVSGFPFGRARALREGAAKVVGGVLIVLGLGFLALAAWSRWAAVQG